MMGCSIFKRSSSRLLGQAGGLGGASYARDLSALTGSNARPNAVIAGRLSMLRRSISFLPVLDTRDRHAHLL
jgi:hypothetical protein